MIEELFKELSMLEQVDAIALGGSRAGHHYDEKSDYDVYIYCNHPILETKREEILSKYCKVMEIGNHFWEYEDNCVLNNDIDIDIIYRHLDDFINDLSYVVEKYQPHNGYTTCMWHNLLTCKIIYDKNGHLQAAKERFQVVYPKQLKKNIIERNMKLLYSALPAYQTQIQKAVNRKDIISINHRTAAFFESYFDIIFALNEKTHPGEKRLIPLSMECDILPQYFKENIEKLYKDLFHNDKEVSQDIENIIKELSKVVYGE